MNVNHTANVLTFSRAYGRHARTTHIRLHAGVPLVLDVLCAHLLSPGVVQVLFMYVASGTHAAGCLVEECLGACTSAMTSRASKRPCCARLLRCNISLCLAPSQSEDLFSTEASESDLRRLRKELEEGRGSDVELSQYPPTTAAALLVQFFSQLPMPLSAHLSGYNS